MPIRPQQGFRNRKETGSQVLRLPSDNRAAPYRELAKASAQMSGLALDMWNASEKDRVDRETVQLRETHALEKERIKKTLKDTMATRRDGKVADDLTYSQAMSNGLDTLNKTMRASTSDNAVWDRFSSQTAAGNRKFKVDGLIDEQTFRTATSIKDQKVASQTQAGIVALESKDTYLETGLKAHEETKLSLAEKVEDRRYNQITSNELKEHNGSIMATTMVDAMVTHGDISGFKKMFGVGLDLDKDTADFQRRLEDKGVIIKEELARIEKDERFQEIAAFVPPALRLQAYRGLLRTLENKLTSNRSQLNAVDKDIDSRLQSGDTNPALTSEMRELDNKSKAAGIAPAVRANRTANKFSLIDQQRLEDTIAFQPPSKAAALIEKFDSRVGQNLTEYYKNDPEMTKELKRPSVAGSTKGSSMAANVATAKRLHKEKNAHSATYVMKHSTDMRKAWANAESDPKIGAIANIAKTMKKIALQAGTEPTNLKLSPEFYSKEQGAVLTDLYKSGGFNSMKNLSLKISELQRAWGSEFSAFMNELDSDKLLSDTGPSLALAATIDKVEVRTRFLRDSFGLAANKKVYDDLNVSKDRASKKIFEFDQEFSQQFSKELPFFISGRDSQGRASEQTLRYASIVKARFYALKQGLVADSDDNDVLKQAFQETNDALFDKITTDGAKILVPKSFKVPKENSEAAVRVLMNRGASAKVDIQAYEKNFGALEGMTDSAKQKIISDRVRSNLVVYTPTPHGGLPNGGGLRLGVRTPRGVLPFIEMTDGTSMIYDIPYDSIRNNADVIVETAIGD